MPILNIGDTLFGGTVTNFEMGRLAYDTNTITFSYAIDNGPTAIGVATITAIPEPWTMVSAGIGLVGFGVIARNRRNIVRAKPFVSSVIDQYHPQRPKSARHRSGRTASAR